MLYCCNYCGHVPDFGEYRSYFMSSCGHILCEQCSGSGGLGASVSVCPTCRTDCRYANITNDPKPEIHMYFTDPLEVLKEGLNRVAKISQFQTSQTQRYKNQMNKLVDQLHVLQRERDSLQNENAALKKKVDALEQRDQDWIGNGIIASPRGGGNGFYVPPSPLIPEPSPFFGVERNSSIRSSNSPAFISPAIGGSGGSSIGNSRLTRPHAPTFQDIQSQSRQNQSQHRSINLGNRLYQSSSIPVHAGFNHHSDRKLTQENLKFRARPNQPNITGSNNSLHTNVLLSRLHNLSNRNGNRSKR